MHPSSVFLLKFNPLKNRSIINSYIYSFLFFWKTNVFFFLFFKISKNRPKFQRIFLELCNISTPNLLRFQSIFMESIFQKIQILKQVQNGPVNRDKTKTLGVSWTRHRKVSNECMKLFKCQAIKKTQYHFGGMMWNTNCNYNFFK